MEIILLLFLKLWSILWSFMAVSIIYYWIKLKRKDFILNLNTKTCFEWCFYITSCYSWFL